MTWPRLPVPAQARALLLLPSGHRVMDHDLQVMIPVPQTLRLTRVERGTFHLAGLHTGELDGETRALYVLGGPYRPHGYPHKDRNAPDEAYDQ